MNRRDFLRQSLACIGLGCLPMVTSGVVETDISSFEPLAMSPGSQFASIQKDRRAVWAWLRMFDPGTTYPIPTSEARYLANLENIDVAMPTNGGRLQADGTWWQQSFKIDPDWPQSLPGIASAAGHLYIPVVDNDKSDLSSYLTVLDNPDLQSTAADNLVALALTDRFDSPWDAVLLDFEATPITHRQQLIDFYYVICDRLKQANLPVGISVRGRTSDNGTHDLTVVAEVADFVDLRCYGYQGPQPKSIGPYWWLEACIQFALSSGVLPEKLTLGLGNFSKYWPDSTQGHFVEITYESAIQLVDDAGSTVEWIENNQNGLVREWFATIMGGHVWIHDSDTHRFGLNLVDQYQLLGISPFAVGMGDDLHWQVTADWRRRHGSFLPIVVK